MLFREKDLWDASEILSCRLDELESKLWLKLQQKIDFHTNELFH